YNHARHGKRKRASRTISRMLLWVHSLTRAPLLEIVHEAVLLAAPAVRTMSHTQCSKIVSRPIAHAVCVKIVPQSVRQLSGPDPRGASCARDYCHRARNELYLGRKGE